MDDGSDPEFYRELSETLQQEVKSKDKNLSLLEELVARGNAKTAALEQQLAVQEQRHLAAMKHKNQQVATLQAELDGKASHIAQVMTQLLAYKRAAKEVPPSSDQTAYSVTHSFSPSPPKSAVPKLHRRRLSSTTDQQRLSSTGDVLRHRQQHVGTPPVPDPTPFLLQRQVTSDARPVDAYHEKTVLPPITRSWEADEKGTSPRSRNTYALVSQPHLVESSTSPEVQLETLAIGQTRQDRNIRQAQKYNGTD